MIISDVDLYARCTADIPAVLADNGWTLVAADDQAFMGKVVEVVRERLRRSSGPKEAAVPSMIRRAITNVYCERLYRAYKQDGTSVQEQAMQEVFQFVYRRLLLTAEGDEQLAYQCANDAVNIAWQTWERVRDPGSFLGYVQRIGVNGVLAVLKEAARKIDLLSDEEDENDNMIHMLHEPSPDPEQQYESQALARRIYQVIGQCLSASREARIIIEMFVHGKRYVELATEWQITASYLHGLKFRALKKIRDCEAFIALRREWFGVN